MRKPLGQLRIDRPVLLLQEWKGCVVLLVALIQAWQCEAGHVTINRVDGTINVTSALVTADTYERDMVGMLVTAVFSDGFRETAVWTTRYVGGVLWGAATGTGWGLWERGHTGAQFVGTNVFPWWLRHDRAGALMTELLIDAGPGNTVFDLDSPAPGTPNSRPGYGVIMRSYDLTRLGLHVEATYSDLVAVRGSAPAGDIYRRLRMRFLPGLVSGTWIRFAADTDSIRGIQALPEPGTLVSLLLGGMGAALRRLRATRG